MKFSHWLVLGFWAVSTASLADEGPIAGLLPDRRPEGAPKIMGVSSDETQQAMALRGIAEPRNGLGFLKNQGAWYTPFNRPNLPGRYDIRGLHASDRKN